MTSDRQSSVWGSIRFGPPQRSGTNPRLFEAQVSLFERSTARHRHGAADGHGVLWTVVLAAIFLRHSEPLGRRLYVVALLVVARGALVAAVR
jgi:hypothetical protein